METNNISTIATFLAIILSTILTYFGYQIEEGTLIGFTTGLITLIIAIWSSKNPNTLEILGNKPQPIQTEETILNDEYTSDNNAEC